MICHKCKTPVTAGDRCPACNTTLAMLVPPPGEFNKKDDLYQKTLELRAGQVDEAVVLAYLKTELAKLETARGKLREGEAPVLVEGLDCWQKALEQTRIWLTSRSDFDVQSALNLATQADACINRSIQDQFEANREMLRQFQAEARLRENPPPELPEDGLLIGFKLGDDPKKGVV